MSLEPCGDAGPSTESENKITKTDAVIVVEEQLTSPPVKRLKQTRLPFSPLVQQQEVSTNNQGVAKRKQAYRDSLKKFSNVEENEDDEVSSTQMEIETSQVDVEAKKSDTEVEKMETDEEQVSDDVNKSLSDASNLDETICEVKDDDSDAKLDESGEIADKTETSKNKRKKRLSEEEKVEFKRRKAEEAEKRRAKKEEERLKRERLKEEAKLKREEAKLKKEEKQKEILAKKQENEMKKEERRLKLEEKKRKKEEEKQELLAKKMEEKQANEEKKKQQELEKSLIEEEKKQTAAKFVGFFKKHSSTTSQRKPELSTLFKSFEVKENQRLAPITRCKLEEIQIENLNKRILNQTTTELYLSELKSKKRIPCKSERTWPINEEDIQIVNENEEVPTKKKFPRAKLLKFHENVRPPYWGTWRKTSRVILPRTPFRKDDGIFDYEVDSNDEWEEEEPGESLSATEDEMEKSDGEYEVDNDFFVPHGYLSDNEQQDEDNEDEALTPDGQKIKLRLQEIEFLAERKQKFSQIKPKLFGPIWCDDEKPGVEEILKLFKQFEVVVLCSNLPMKINKVQLTTDLSGAQDGASTSGTTATTALRLKVVPEEVMPNFIRLVHGNFHRKALIIQEFIRFWEQRQDEKIKNEEDSATTTGRKKLISKSKIDKRLQDIATWDKSPNGGKRKWIVKKEILDRYSLSDLSLNNEWKYLTNIDEVTEEKTVTKPDDTSKTPKKSIPDAAKLKERSNLDKSVVKEPAVTPKSKELTLDKFFKKRNSSVNLNDSKDDALNDSKNDSKNDALNDSKNDSKNDALNDSKNDLSNS